MAGRQAGLVKQLEHEVSARMLCDTRGCGEVAFVRVRVDGVPQNLCRRCYEGQRNSEALDFCKKHGLTTVAQMRAYCARLARSGHFGGASFAEWADRLTQAAVDRIIILDSRDTDRTLEKLRAHGVIDEKNKLIPPELRAAARAAHEAKVQEERDRVAAALAAQGIVRTEAKG